MFSVFPLALVLAYAPSFISLRVIVCVVDNNGNACNLNLSQISLAGETACFVVGDFGRRIYGRSFVISVATLNSLPNDN